MGKSRLDLVFSRPAKIGMERTTSSTIITTGRDGTGRDSGTSETPKKNPAYQVHNLLG